MATSISARLARTQKKDVFNSSSIALVSKLRQEGQLNSVENVMKSIDQVSKLLSSGIEGYSLTDSILNMCQHLKVYGACLEVLYKDQLDKAFVVFRNGSQNEQLDYTSRLHLLELIELRANQWKGTDVMSQYYRKKINHEMEMSANEPQVAMESSVLMSPVSPPILGPGEIMKSSGKFPKPTRIPGKNYCKDEVVIRNADSGKVNPGAKERLVQITGANESSINHAKQLIEDTIRRNASPIRDSNMNIGTLAGSSSSLNSSGSEDSVPGIMPGRGNLLHSFSTNDANVGEYKYTVTIGNTDTIKITGHNLDLVRLGKIVLDEYFNGRAMNHGSTEFFTVDAMPRSPISPIESNENESNLFLNGSAMQEPVTPIIEDEYKPIRKPNLKLDLSQVQKTTENKGVQNSSPDKVKRQYSHECLVRMSMSPKAICAPDNWEKITNQHPEIVRKKYSRRLPYLHDQRVADLTFGILNNRPEKNYLNNENKDSVEVEDLERLSQTSFPLCMKSLYDTIKTTHHMKHFGRLQFGLFLKGIGLSLENAIKYWRGEFTKIMDEDKFTKNYVYNIKHSYGTIGKMTNYTPYSCMKIISSNVGPGECHGCPFKHWELDTLRRKMADIGINTDGMKDVLDTTRAGHYQIACSKYFMHTHGGQESKAMINHPNQYFEESQELHKSNLGKSFTVNKKPTKQRADLKPCPGCNTEPCSCPTLSTHDAEVMMDLAADKVNWEETI